MTESSQSTPEHIAAAHDATSTEIRLRSYQQEMLEQSLDRNVIVAMETGSGKTHIAIARAAAELERCERSKIVWFLGPTVALCDQQHKAFQLNLPAYQSRFLSGADNIEAWSDQSTWDAILHNIQIVVCTHQVLLDALSHGFVQLSSIALLIFDEAHHCVRNHAGSQIMRFAYASDPASQHHRPPILGLSASPAVRAKASDMDILNLESSLDAVVVTPKLNRTELLKHVHQPELVDLLYSMDASDQRSALLTGLEQVYMHLDIMEDPYVLELLDSVEADPRLLPRLEKVIVTRKTYCQIQMKQLYQRACHIHDELGAWTCDWYISECILRFTELLNQPTGELRDWTMEEKNFLLSKLQLVMSTGINLSTAVCDSVSRKLDTLLDLLMTEHSDEFNGIIFVEQRATVAALSHLLSTHARSRELFEVGSFVGTSNNSQRKTSISELAEFRVQQQHLTEFRTGRRNLIVCTSVLEEGIDISACHIVICFDPPRNLKAFVQRRGRARRQQSKYVILRSHSDLGTMDDWHELEQEMKHAYMQDRELVRQAEEKENAEEEAEFVFRIESTGAFLTGQSALAHLNHFCAISRAADYVDSRPQFNFIHAQPPDLIFAEITLPVFIDPQYRQMRSIEAWKTEKQASRDASFNACLTLWRAGLLNDHFLPVLQEPEGLGASSNLPAIDAIVKAQPTMDPWAHAASRLLESPGDSSQWARHSFVLKLDGIEKCRMDLLLPQAVMWLQPFLLHWNKDTTYTAEISFIQSEVLSAEEVRCCRLSTAVILAPVHKKQPQTASHDHLALLVPSGFEYRDLESWVSNVQHEAALNRTVCAAISKEPDTAGLIREQSRPAEAYTIQGLVERDSVLYVQALKFAKRRNFLHPLPPDSETLAPAHTGTHLLEASSCSMDMLPLRYSLLSVFIPSVLYRLESALIAEALEQEHLRSLQLSDMTLLMTAITSSAANDTFSYQKIEFLGDCVLKYITALNLTARHLHWPESYLTSKKDRITSNNRLARAALSLGLDRFIVRNLLATAKWKPPVASGRGMNQKESAKTLSSKTLADVVESIIGACYLDEGGTFGKASRCLQLFLPEEQWFDDLDAAQQRLFDSTPDPESLKRSTDLQRVERIVGRHFNKAFLLREALTHPSFNPPRQVHELEKSYQRLEFLGDAILDFLIVRKLFELAPHLGHAQLHTLRTSVANAYILAFFCVEFTVPEERYEITQGFDDDGQPTATLREDTMQDALWTHMRASSAEVRKAAQATLARHNACRQQILEALSSSRRYPWAMLENIGAEKFFSDLIESVLGAIFVDTCGNLDMCQSFLERLGLIGLLSHLVSNGIDCLHPKERIGMVADVETVKYTRVVESEGPGWHCTIAVGGKQIGSVVTGFARAGAETLAATRALQELGHYTNEAFEDGTPAGDCLGSTAETL